MKVKVVKHVLNFKNPAGTSRGVLRSKDTWFLILEENEKIGIGECGMFPGLSYDDRPEFEARLIDVCDQIKAGEIPSSDSLKEFPSIQFGLETAILSLNSINPFILFESDFTKANRGIPINGLVWMGDKDKMSKQIQSKLNDGFRCLKLKIGAIDFDAELDLLAYIRSQYSAKDVEIRVDANGAFSPANALTKLEKLSKYQLHSIEQPIKQGQWSEMAKLCKMSPIPIALDEELIGVVKGEDKQQLLTQIKPTYIILKPTLVGGFSSCNEWISLAENEKIDWWITSALESNIGLNAIAQFTATKSCIFPQGLGTGNLFTNNIEGPLNVNNGKLFYNSDLLWDTRIIKEVL